MADPDQPSHQKCNVFLQRFSEIEGDPRHGPGKATETGEGGENDSPSRSSVGGRKRLGRVLREAARNRYKQGIMDHSAGMEFRDLPTMPAD
jgi:hypothetical protein